MNRLLLFCGLCAIYGLAVTAQNNVSSTTSTESPTSLSAIVSIVTDPHTSETTNSTNATTVTTTTESSTNATTTQSTPITTTLSPPPTMPPSPEAPKTPWNVTDVNGTVCILADFALTFRIEYNSTDIKHNITGFNLPPEASVDEKSSKCGNNVTQVLVLNFNNINQTNGNITFTFNQTNGNIFVDKIKLYYNLTEDLFPNYVNKEDYGKMIIIENDGLNLFNVDKSHSYRCNSQTSTQLENNTRLEFSNAKIQAYIPNGQYSDESVCKQDNSTEISDAVPIAVGASLAALVLIVLIAYFIGRRRSRRMAYTSV